MSADDVELLAALKGAAEAVLRGFRESPGGDAYEYHGGMNDVEWLRDALRAVHAQMWGRAS